MLTKSKTTTDKFILECENIKITTLFSDNKIYLTKKEISKLFNTKKRIVKDIIKNQIINSEVNNNIKIYNKKKEKNEIFYSLDTVISIGYRLNSYEKTKFLVNSNLLLKDYNSKRKHNLKQKSSISNLIGNIFNNINKSVHVN